MTLITPRCKGNGEEEEWAWDDLQISELAAWMGAGDIGRKKIQEDRTDNNIISETEVWDIFRMYRCRYLLINRI